MATLTVEQIAKLIALSKNYDMETRLKQLFDMIEGRSSIPSPSEIGARIRLERAATLWRLGAGKQLKMSFPEYLATIPELDITHYRQDLVDHNWVILDSRLDLVALCAASGMKVSGTRFEYSYSTFNKSPVIWIVLEANRSSFGYGPEEQYAGIMFSLLQRPERYLNADGTAVKIALTGTYTGHVFIEAKRTESESHVLEVTFDGHPYRDDYERERWE